MSKDLEVSQRRYSEAAELKGKLTENLHATQESLMREKTRNSMLQGILMKRKLRERKLKQAALKKRVEDSVAQDADRSNLCWGRCIVEDDSYRIRRIEMKGDNAGVNAGAGQNLFGIIRNHCHRVSAPSIRSASFSTARPQQACQNTLEDRADHGRAEGST